MVVMRVSMFITMVVTQVFIMPYVMTDRPADVQFSLSQLYMGIFMGALMIAGDGIFHPLSWPVWILIIALAGLSVLAYRQQWFVSDAQYLHDMIPHHSMAILTSKAKISSTDPVIQRLAEDIIKAQEREIIQMKAKLAFGSPVE